MGLCWIILPPVTLHAHCVPFWVLQVVRSFAKGPVEALQIAATEFGRLANQITTGAASRAC
jgi:hypothetical protein